MGSLEKITASQGKKDLSNPYDLLNESSSVLTQEMSFWFDSRTI